MNETILISLPKSEFQDIIIDCVNACLKHNHTTLPSLEEADQLLTIQEAAQFISLSVPTVYGLVSKSLIPVSKKGKRLYFSKAELTDWIKTGRRKTIAETASEADNFLQAKKKGGIKL